MATRADITFKPVAGRTSEQARDTRARAWMFVFDVWNSKKAAGRLPSPDGRDGTKTKEDSADAPILHER